MVRGRTEALLFGNRVRFEHHTVDLEVERRALLRHALVAVGEVRALDQMALDRWKTNLGEEVHLLGFGLVIRADQVVRGERQPVRRALRLVLLFDGTRGEVAWVR